MPADAQSVSAVPSRLASDRKSEFTVQTDRVGWTGASPLRVIVADDDASVRSKVRQALDATTDLELIATARDGAEAWHIAHELKPDVLVLDDQMPIVDGLGVLARLMREAARIRIVMYAVDPAICAEAVELVLLAVSRETGR